MRRHIWHIGDMDRTRLQETGEVKIPGVVILAAINSMASDLGINYEDLLIYCEDEMTIIKVKS
jgi:hypothetical protein